MKDYTFWQLVSWCELLTVKPFKRASSWQYHARFCRISRL